MPLKYLLLLEYLIKQICQQQKHTIHSTHTIITQFYKGKLQYKSHHSFKINLGGWKLRVVDYFTNVFCL